MARADLSSVTAGENPEEHLVYLGLGSNLGDRETNLRAAIEQINRLIGVVERRSAFYVTEPWGFSSPNKFVNACVASRTVLSPRQVLEATQQIEKSLGRAAKSQDGVYHDRPIDIDILLYDDLVIDEPGLRIPHPLMHEREFVMQPLREIWPLK